MGEAGMMRQVSVERIFAENEAKLGLRWVAGRQGGNRVLTGEAALRPTIGQVGHMNFIHPFRIQILGAAELANLNAMPHAELEAAIERLFTLELISRGNGLIADDIVELYRISPDTLEGRCPAVLRDFLEVRGIGILNIRTIFGETAVRPRKLLKFMVHLEDHSNEAFSELDRLQVNATFQEILGVPVRKVTIPVAAGRNLAVLVEAAVRNFVLNQRGIDSTKEFIERQTQLMEDGG